ncbi:MAG: NAD(P)-dependent oxidoreductase [Christensenellaceae bacterium]|nr:NAD(P)-dependent oxidoreductase [Christensenellaceae bacterium]MEA5065766.1 NAD(P)-dependent oxidoreductase [Eubacteriales bacterium]MEA5068824.1 NAD(P)-dependent oxidoreductase [Christensenellaceae bacterium]
MNRIRRILITGGSGSIGGRLARRLTQQGYHVRVADQVPPQTEVAEFMLADILRQEDMEQATRDMDMVIHLAAIPVENGDSRKIFHVNLEGTFNVLDAAAKNDVKRFVFASSVVVYALLKPSKPFAPAYFPVDEEMPLIPDRNYSVGKTAAEAYMKAYARLYDMDAIALRLATVMAPKKGGKWSWYDVVADIDNPEVKFGNLSMRDFMWQYVHVEDAVQAFEKVVAYAGAQSGFGFEAFNIGAEDCMCGLPTLELIRRYFPDVPLLKAPARYAENPNAALYGIDKAKRMLGYRPEYTWRVLLEEDEAGRG